MSFGNVAYDASAIARMAEPERLLAAALDRESRPETAARKIAVAGPTIALGKADIGGNISIDLEKILDGRLLVQGQSGAGKSWTIRRIVEKTNGIVQQVIIDPEGEFGTLAEHFDFPVLDGARLDPGAIRLAATRVREHRLDVLLDISQIDREAQMQMVTAFLTGLIEAPQEHWTPVLVVIDEAHLFAPFGGAGNTTVSVRQAATQAVTDLMSRGRKRGLAGVLATQRIAKLSKSVSSEILNFLIGLNTLDIDIRRAAETIGWDAARAFDRLPALTPGTFVASGPAFSFSPTVLHVGSVKTRHIGARPEIIRPAKVGADRAAELLDLDLLMLAAERDQRTRSEGKLPAGFKAVREFIRDPAFADAGVVWTALAGLVPNGALVAQLPELLGGNGDRAMAAIALLDHYNVVEISDGTAGRAVRLARGMV